LDCDLQHDTCVRKGYKLSPWETKEFRGYCSETALDILPDKMWVTALNYQTSCTIYFPWVLYGSISCTNWDFIKSDRVNIHVKCPW
jgi:hypothetical protein